MRVAGGRFAYVRRLTAVKFPAIWRKGAYKHQRCDEQAAWFERIIREPDFEAVELAKMLTPEFAEARSGRAFGEVVKEFGGEVEARLRSRLRKWGLMAPRSCEAFFRALRRFKGLV